MGIDKTYTVPVPFLSSEAYSCQGHWHRQDRRVLYLDRN